MKRVKQLGLQIFSFGYSILRVIAGVSIFLFALLAAGWNKFKTYSVGPIKIHKILKMVVIILAGVYLPYFAGLVGNSYLTHGNITVSDSFLAFWVVGIICLVFGFWLVIIGGCLLALYIWAFWGLFKGIFQSCKDIYSWLTV